MDRGKDWCILRTGGARTLALAQSLAAVGFDVWTPTQMAERRKGPARVRIETPAPITPTFVFARARHVADLLRASADPLSSHPSFSVFHYRDRIPLISDRSLAALREEEARQRLKRLKQVRCKVEPGTKVYLTEGAFAGLPGIVERSNGKEALVNFGGGFVVTIASYILQSDVIQSRNIAA